MQNHLAVYGTLIGHEAALAWLAISRIHAAGQTIRDVTGRWREPPDVLRDILLAAAMWGVWSVFAHLTATPAKAAVQSMLPVDPLESVVWIILSVSAGFAEELAFRGALQGALQRRFGVPLAILGQAVIFGVVHAYQGGAALLRIVVYGLLFGAVARWRRSVAPGMIAHAWTDIASGLLRF
jgi:membrane protease YdiL (CAAX protease family)